jgi:hypothetical protein
VIPPSRRRELVLIVFIERPIPAKG